MPELPEMQALAERLADVVGGAAIAGVDPLGFAALKTVVPPPESVVGHTVRGVGRRAKYLVLELDDGVRILIHLSQAGRLDIEEPPKKARPKGAAVRIRFDNGRALLVREHGTERKAAWWVLAPGDDGPLERLGPEPDSEEFAELILHGSDKRRIHTILRDQRTVSGIGRGYTNDALHRAHVSPYATLASLSETERKGLLDAIQLDARRRARRASGSAPAACRSRSSASGSGSTTARGARARSAATVCAASRTSPTRSRTAPPARPAARSSPTAASPAW